MIKRFLIATACFVVAYLVLFQFQVLLLEKQAKRAEAPSEAKGEASSHKVYSFSFSKYTTSGDKEIEIEGDSADVFAKNVILRNVIAKAYAEETPVTITADEGVIDKATSKVQLSRNVVATTQEGTRLLTEVLDILPHRKMLKTEIEAQVKKDNINIEGIGAQGDSRLKKVKFKKKVTVVVKNPESESGVPTVITCDGPLVVEYDKNIAHFHKNVVAEDERGTLRADWMDVYYNQETRKISRIIAIGNVVVENPDGNQTFSDSVTYLAEEGRIILGGDAEALYLRASREGGFDGGFA